MQQLKEKKVWRDKIRKKNIFSGELSLHHFLEQAEEWSKIKVHFPKYQEGKICSVLTRSL